MLIASGLAAVFSGFAVGLGLVLSIGPQNLHLIRAGARTGRGWITASVGYGSEILIFLVAATWLAAALHRVPQAVWGLYLLGIAFLLWCALRTLRNRRRRPDGLGTLAAGRALRRDILGMLSVTWLNPLVYLEVGLVAGTLAIAQEGDARAAFAAGFLTASAIRFYGWSTVGRYLGPWLDRGDRMIWFNTASGMALILIASAMVWHGLATPF